MDDAGKPKHSPEPGSTDSDAPDGRKDERSIAAYWLCGIPTGMKRNIVYGKYTAVVTLSNDPNGPTKPDRWVLTAFQESDKSLKK